MAYRKSQPCKKRTRGTGGRVQRTETTSEIVHSALGYMCLCAELDISILSGSPYRYSVFDWMEKRVPRDSDAEQTGGVSRLLFRLETNDESCTDGEIMGKSRV